MYDPNNPNGQKLANRQKKPALIQDSTRDLWREGRRTPDYGLFDFLHGYVYARWPYLYIGVAIGEHRLSPIIAFISRLFVFLIGQADPVKAGRDFADTYHGKVLPLAEATRLVQVNEPITVRDLEQVVPYARARSIVLQNPDHIVALECPCRSSRAEPCLPLDVCLIVGEPFASFVQEHHPGRSRWITSAEAVAILQAENERGHVHHAFFKDAMLGRFYAICNCCACCCGAMQGWRNNTPMLASSGYVCEIDADLCLGCGECVDHCQFAALTLDVGVVWVDWDTCLGCGVCESHCQNGAAKLVSDPAKGEPFMVHTLLADHTKIESAEATIFIG